MKKLCLFILSILLLFQLTVHARFLVQDVECLTGNDFVQLHFKSDQIIPIPDIFYPQKNNYQFIVMRINDIDMNIPRKQLDFDSPVIRDVRIVDQKKYVDVEITLKEKVNYRVFTNQNGVYIEFPNIKNISSASRTSAGVAEREMAAIDEEKEEPVKKKEAPVTYPVAPLGTGEKGSIRSFRVADRDAGSVTFHFVLSKSIEYRVIPIPDQPSRLAIDLVNARSKRIQENVNFLNVNRVRGAYNSPEVYRLVFDLDYLKNYSVRLNNNILEVSFYEQEKPKELAQNTQVPETEEPAVRETKTEPSPQPALDEPVKISPTDLAMRKKVAAIQNLETVSDEPARTQKDQAVGGSESRDVTGLNTQTVNPVPAKSEFFSEEKSQVSSDDFTENFLNAPEEEESGSGTPIIKQTIAEGQKRYQGEPMDFNFKDADLNNVLLFFAKISGLNFLIDPNVTGKVTASMTQVPWDQALEYFLRVNKLDMIQEGNIIRIGKVDVLAREAQDRRKLREAREMEGQLEVFTVPLSYAKVDEISSILKKYLSQRGEIVTDKRTNQLIITDISRNRATIDKLIETLDLPTRQVSIEARIVETEINYTKNFGIQWGFNFIADSFHGNQTSLAFPNSIGINGSSITDVNAPGIANNPLGGYAINLPAPTFSSGVGFSFGNVADTFRLDVALTAMQKDGKGKVISAPKATTQDNQQATIQQGRQIPVQTIQNNTVTTRYVPAALELRVTPQITAEGTIITKLFITNNSADFANLVQGIPPIITQKMETTVMVKDGGTIVIGGLYRVEDSKNMDSVPLLSKIPILGSLFKNSQRTGKQTELLIFITPRIIK